MIPQPTPPPSPLVRLARALESLPKFAFGFLMDLIFASITDIVSASLLIASVALGFATGSVLIAASAFFFIFVAANLVNNVCAAIASVGRAVQSSNPPPQYTVVQPPVEEHSVTQPE